MAHRRSLLLFALAALSMLASACEPPTVSYVLRFPSEATFLLSATATVDVYDGTGTEDSSPDAICRALSIGQPAPVNTIHSTGKRDVCDFLLGDGLPIESVDTGRLVLFAEAEDGSGSLLLRGCTVVDVLPDTEQVDVQLSTLPSYPEDPSIDCPNQQAKCEDRSC
jgi:hypothetical protein